MAWIERRTTKRGPRWRVIWRSEGQRRTSPPFTTEYEAKAYRTKVESDALKGFTTDYSGGEQLFRSYAGIWLDARLVRGRPLSASTRYGYERLLERNIYPSLGETRLRAITTTTVQSWLAQTVRDAGQDQAAKSYRVLRAIMGSATAEELIGRNPCQIRGAGQEDATERPLVDTAVVLHLADAIIPRLRLLVLLAGFGALRTGEILALRRSDTDLLHGSVLIDESAPEIGGKRVLGSPKSDAGRRTVNLPSSLMTAVQDHLDAYVDPSPDSLVFTAPRGGPWYRSHISEEWRKAVAQVHAPTGLRIHDLRHHGATLTARKPGITTKELMARIGHSSPAAALRYQHAVAERDRQVAEFMDDEIAKALSQRSNVVELRP